MLTRFSKVFKSFNFFSTGVAKNVSPFQILSLRNLDGLSDASDILKEVNNVCEPAALTHRNLKTGWGLLRTNRNQRR